MILSSVKKFSLIGLTVIFPLCGFAQPAEETANPLHNQLHHKLLADQVNITKEINLLDSVTAKYRLHQEEEEYPALDLYSDSWDNMFVNPYKRMSIQLPDSVLINVSRYGMPAPGHTKITSNFGKRGRRFHYGVDLKVNTGDTIYAAFDGKVRLTRYERRGYGYHIVIRHSNGLETVYGHLSRFLVKPGETVKIGDPIGLGGNTGRSTGSHLHFETRLLGVAINPNDIFDFQNQVTHTDTYLFKPKKKNSVVPDAVSNGTSYAYHRIRQGDTLGKLARKYGVSVNQLCRLNNIKSTTILRLGQKIRYQ